MNVQIQNAESPDVKMVDRHLEIRDGLHIAVRGACNVGADQLAAVLEAAERLGIGGYQVIQNGYSLLVPTDERAVRSICVDKGLAFMAFSPRRAAR